MEADECAAANWNSWWCPRHHVVIAGAVVSLVVPKRAYDRQVIADRGQFLHRPSELDAGCLGHNRLIRTPNFDGCIGLRVKRFVMTGTSVLPHQDARIGLRGITL